MVYSIKEVFNEIRRKDDELAEWVEGLDDNFFIEINSNVEGRLKDIDSWIKTQNYTDAAVDAFKKGRRQFSCCPCAFGPRRIQSCNAGKTE